MTELVLELRPYQLESEMPEYGGLLDIDLKRGVARCCGCGWRGVPTLRATRHAPVAKWEGTREHPRQLPLRPVVEAIVETVCPACRVGEPAEAPPRVSRNAPCPCGSGVKAKKCCSR